MSFSRRTFTLGLGAMPLLRSTPLESNEHRSGKAAGEEQVAAAAVPKPRLFDDHELATIAAIAEVIIPATDTPGARDAHVAEYLDLILSDSPESVSTTFREGLWWTDGYCLQSAGTPFKDLPSDQQLRVVSNLHDSSEAANRTGHLFIRSMKIWTTRIYYSTQAGEQEMNKGGRVPADYTGHCES